MAKSTAAAAFSSTGSAAPASSGKGAGKQTKKTTGVRRTAAKGSSSAMDLALLTAEVGGATFIASTAYSRFSKGLTFFEGQDGKGGIDGRLLFGLPALIGTQWLANGSIKTHAQRAALGLTYSWLAEKGSTWGTDMAAKAAVADAPASSGLTEIGVLDPESGRINTRRADRIQKRLDHLRQEKREALGKGPGRYRPAPAQLGDSRVVTVPISFLRPAYAAQLSGVDDGADG